MNDSVRERELQASLRKKGPLVQWIERLVLVAAFSAGMLGVIWAIAVSAESLQARANRSLIPQWDESRDPALGFSIAHSIGPIENFAAEESSDDTILLAYLGGCGGCSLQHPAFDEDRMQRFRGVVCVIQYEGQHIPSMISALDTKVRVVVDKDGAIGRMLNSTDRTRLFAVDTAWKLVEKQRMSEAGFEFVRRIIR